MATASKRAYVDKQLIVSLNRLADCMFEFTPFIQ
jgi:hypothetical protein